MLTDTANEKVLKRQSLRNNEYYGMQETFDKLYKDSQSNKKFKNLYELIVDRENILLAYRNIKKNKGSFTKGVNESTITTVGEQEPEKLVSYVRKRLETLFHIKLEEKKYQKLMAELDRWEYRQSKTELYINVLSKFLNQYVKRNFIITVMGLDQIEVHFTHIQGQLH